MSAGTWSIAERPSVLLAFGTHREWSGSSGPGNLGDAPKVPLPDRQAEPGNAVGTARQTGVGLLAVHETTIARNHTCDTR